LTTGNRAGAQNQRRQPLCLTKPFAKTIISKVGSTQKAVSVSLRENRSPLEFNAPLCVFG
jgi:hypothetical protein